MLELLSNFEYWQKKFKVQDLLLAVKSARLSRCGKHSFQFKCGIEYYRPELFYSYIFS